MFLLELRRGIEVRIPHQLSQNDLSISYRYYDAIINLIKARILTIDKTLKIDYN